MQVKLVTGSCPDPVIAHTKKKKKSNLSLPSRPCAVHVCANYAGAWLSGVVHVSGGLLPCSLH